MHMHDNKQDFIAAFFSEAQDALMSADLLESVMVVAGGHEYLRRHCEDIATYGF